MIIQSLTTSFVQQLLEGAHNFKTTGNTFKLALYTSSANLNSSTTAYTTTGEASASGYTAGGATLTNVDPSSTGTVGYTQFSTVTWASSGLSDVTGGLIYNTTPSTGSYTNPSVMVISFGIPRQSDGSGNFTVTFPTYNNLSALIRLNVSP